MSHSFIQNCCWITLQVKHNQGWDLCLKWKVRLIFQGAYRLPGTGIVGCLEIIDVECKLKQVWWLDLDDSDPPPYFTTDLLHCHRTQNEQSTFSNIYQHLLTSAVRCNLKHVWVVKELNFHPLNLGSSPTVTCISHWWIQVGGHLAKTVPVHQKSYTLHVRPSEPL